MACTSCGKGRKKMNIVINSNNVLPMRTWIEQLGWYYVGKCGCSENKSMFLNNSYPEWKIEIAPLGNRMEIWRMFSPIDGKKIRVGGLQNYQDVYNHWLINDFNKIKINGE